MKSGLATIIIVASAGAAAFAVSMYVWPPERVSYIAAVGGEPGSSATSTEEKPRFVIRHLPTPAAVKAVYMTACIAGTPSLRSDMVSVVGGTQINSVVVDIKDYTGTLAYASTSVPNPRGRGCRIYDLPEFIAQLHDAGLYAIARVTVFQDPLYAGAHPDLAVQSRSRPGKPWVDRKGLAYIDPTYAEYWDYIVEISEEAHAIGFDEINFDYIRFPSDGVMADAQFALPAGMTKSQALVEFFRYLREALAQKGIVMSADLFGQTTVNTDDLGIGQVLEDALPYFDYIAPMNYPSHFIKGFMNYDNPALYPYEVMLYTMTRAAERAIAASTTPDKIRPWLQAFDLGAQYTPEMIGKQIQGVYDAGLTSWMLWDPSNRYTKAELQAGL